MVGFISIAQGTSRLDVGKNGRNEKSSRFWSTGMEFVEMGGRSHPMIIVRRKDKAACAS